MKKIYLNGWALVTFFCLFTASLSHADLCTQQGGTLHDDQCECGGVTFDPETHHCRDDQVFEGSLKKCTVCQEGVKKGELTLTCKAGHEIHEECLALQIESMTHQITQHSAKKIVDEGIDCTGRESNDVRCQHKLPLGNVEQCIGKMKEFTKFKDKLDAAKADHCASSSSASSSSEDPHVLAVRELKGKIEGAFNLCCPGVQAWGEKCRGILSPIEGCNAAKCESCQTTFCYLCLERQPNSGAAHSHVRDVHSGDYWERRDGHTGVKDPAQYTEVEEYKVSEPDPRHPGQRMIRKVQVPYTYKDRYHWLLIRKKLEELLHEEKDEKVKKEIITQLEPLLRKNKMWPLPFATRNWLNWIKAVETDDKIDQRNKVALLQNEYIYLNQIATQSTLPTSPTVASTSGITTVTTKATIQARKNLIAKKLRELKAPVLVSVNLNDAPNGTHVGQGDANFHITPILENHDNEEVRHIFADLRNHAPQFFALGGEAGRIYRITDPNPDLQRRVAPFILSDVAPQRMKHADAIAYCQQIGARLPTEEELEALGRAMSPNGRYDINAIPGMMWGTWFWSSSGLPCTPDLAFGFHSSNGVVYNFGRYNNIQVRCVCAAAW